MRRLDRAHPRRNLRSDFGDFSGDPVPAKSSVEVLDSGMSGQLRAPSRGASVGYEPVGDDDGAMRINLKAAPRRQYARTSAGPPTPPIQKQGARGSRPSPDDQEEDQSRNPRRRPRRCIAGNLRPRGRPPPRALGRRPVAACGNRRRFHRRFDEAAQPRWSQAQPAARRRRRRRMRAAPPATRGRPAAAPSNMRMPPATGGIPPGRAAGDLDAHKPPDASVATVAGVKELCMTRSRRRGASPSITRHVAAVPPRHRRSSFARAVTISRPRRSRTPCRPRLRHRCTLYATNHRGRATSARRGSATHPARETRARGGRHAPKRWCRAAVETEDAGPIAGGPVHGATRRTCSTASELKTCCRQRLTPRRRR